MTRLTGRQRRPTPAALADLPRPILGYVGLVSVRLDLALLDALAAAHPEWTLVLMGEVDRTGCGEVLDRLAGRPNVQLLPPVPGDQVAGYVRAFDLGLLPYRQTQETYHASPLKLYEYLAAGLPVAAADVPGARQFADVIDHRRRPARLGNRRSRRSCDDIRRRWRQLARPRWRRTPGTRGSRRCRATWPTPWPARRGQRPAMKIAMILRPDADRVFGGDTVVMQKLSAALRDLGADHPGRSSRRDAIRARVRSAAYLHAHASGSRGAHGGLGAERRRADRVFAALLQRLSRLVRASDSFGAPLAQPGSEAGPAARLVALPELADVPASLPAFLVDRTQRDCWRPTTVATTSRWENAWLAEHFRFPAAARSRMRISPLGIDAGLYGRTFAESELAAFRQRYDLEPGYVCQVARIEQKKNQLAVIEALFDDPVPLVFVGKDSPYYAPDYPDRCREIAAQRGHVKFLGWLPENELPLLYAASAAHVLPSWMELPGLTSLEAGASGTRVISTQVSAMHELLGDRVWTCDPYDLDSIRAAILAALASPRSTDLREYLLLNYSWPTVAAANLALYEEVLGFSRPNRL